MSRLATSHKKQTANDLTLLTFVLICAGFIVFYFGSLVVTPEDAHLIHWGLAAVGAAAGWLIGLLVQRVRG